MAEGDPRMGETHDVIIHINDSQLLGLVVKPFTYRVRQTPTFLPSLNPTAARGTGRARWKTWSQFRFDGGEGQIFYKGAEANNRFAQSNMIDIGLPVTVFGGVAGVSDPTIVKATPGDALEHNVIGDIQVALVPRATSSNTPLHTLFTNAYPVFVVALSNRPHLFHHRSAMVYTNVTDTALWAEGSVRGGGDPLTGKWVVVNTQLGGGQGVVGAVAYSGVVIVGLQDSGVYVYGSNSTNNDTAATFYAPKYNTTASNVKVYDRKLWRTDPGRGRAAFFVNETGEWSSFLEVDEAGTRINNMSVFNGRLYFGTPKSLWVFDAGRTYEIEDFSDEEDPHNFDMMVSHRGSLYFNVRQKVYRYSSGGLVELLMTPNFSGIVVGGTSMGGELHILVRTIEGDGKVFVFNADTGGTRQWFKTTDLASNFFAPTGPSSLQHSQGQMWIAPIYMSAALNTLGNTVPIASVNKISPSYGLSTPYFSKTHAYIITSMIDFGHEGLQKQIKDLLVEYSLYSTGDKIEVSYITDLKGSALKAAHTYIGGSFTDVTTELSNGSANPNDGKATGTFGSGDFLYVGFFDPVEGMRVILDATTSQVAKSYVVEYYNGTTWMVVPILADGTQNLTETGYMRWGTLEDFTENIVNSIEAYYLRIAPSSVGGSNWTQEADGDISDFDVLVPTWDQVADIEEGDVTDFDTFSVDLLTNLKAWWRHEESAGATRVDSHGSNDLSDNNTVGTATGKIGQASDYEDGSSHFHHRNDNASLSTGDIDYSFAGWVQLESKPSNRMVIMSRYESGSVREYLLQWNNVEDRFELLIYDTDGGGIGTVQASSFGAPSTGTWYFIYAYHDSVNNVVGISINDGTVNTTATSGVPADKACVTRIGARSATETRFWDGRQDEFAFWKKKLHIQEVTWLYNGGTGRTYSDLVDPATTESVLKGTYGVGLIVDENADVYGALEGATNLTQLTSELLVDPNSLTMADGDIFDIMQLRGSGSGGIAARVQLKKNGPSYEVIAGHANDSGSFTDTNPITIDDAKQAIRVHWTASTGPGNNDGELTLFIKEQRAQRLTGLDSDGHDVDEVRYGAIGVDSGTSGTIYLDEMRWNATVGTVIESQTSTGKYVILISGLLDEYDQYASLDGPTNETEVVLELRVNFDKLEMENGDEFDIVQVRGSGAGVTILSLRVNKDGPNIKIKLVVFDDSSVEQATGYYTVPALDHLIQIRWVASSSGGADDGIAVLLLDNGIQESLSGLDTDTYDVDDIRFGIVNGVDPTTWGTLIFDDCKWLAGTAVGETITFTEINGIGSLLGQKWVPLGSITNVEKETKTMAFPNKYTTEEIMLRFKLFATDITRPEIRRFTYQYETLPAQLIDVNFTTVAADGLILQNGVIENSGAYIATALFSMVMAGTRHVVQIPWPPHVTALTRTINAKIRIAQPGANVPIVPFINTVHPFENSFIGAEFPIRIEEM